VIAVMVSYLVIDKFWLSKQVAEKTPIAAAVPVNVPATPVISQKSVAVLPFVDMSENKDQEYFSDGLSEELIDMLTKIPDLRVPARTSSFYFKGKQATVADIAKALSVAHVLEGSVRKSGNTLRITAQLIRVDNGYHLWSETYDRKLDDIFKIQDEIAAAVVRALKASLIDSAAAAPPESRNGDAYTLYLQGRAMYRNANTKEEYETAANYLERSIKADPTLAAAWTALGFVRVAEVGSGFVDRQTGIREAHRLAERALALDPRLVNTRRLLGRLHEETDFNWPAALREYQKAYALDPADAASNQALATLMTNRGDAEAAVSLFQEAISLDPVESARYLGLAYCFYVLGRLPEAELAARKALDLSPASNGYRFTLGEILLARGQPVMALEEFKRETNPHAHRTGMVLAYDALGRKAEGDAGLAELEQIDAVIGAAEIAQVYAGRGQINQAFAWLDRAYRQQDNSLDGVKVDPLWRNLWSDPRFKAFLRTMNLPE
jgi:adenylate cyclase